MKKNVRAPWRAYLYDNTTRLDLVQFGPWTVMAANAYTRQRPERTDIVDFGLEVARWMVESYAYTTERSPFPDYIGGYYKFEGELPAMQAFCYGEGTAAAYAMALRLKPTEAAYFEKATRETVRLGMQMQHDRLDSSYYPRADLVEGGTRYALNEPKVRVDYGYHAQSTLFQLADMPGFRAPDAPVRTSLPRGVVTGDVTVPSAFEETPIKASDDEAGE